MPVPQECILLNRKALYKKLCRLNYAYINSEAVANAERFNIASVNMSLGDPGNYNTPQKLNGIDDELAALAARGVITVSSAGNDFRTWNSQQGSEEPVAPPIAQEQN